MINLTKQHILSAHFLKAHQSSSRCLNIFIYPRRTLWKNNKDNKDLEGKKSASILDQFKDKYIYNRKQFELVNNQQFLEKIRKIEERNSLNDNYNIDGLMFPAFLVLGSLFIYYCWQTVPYNIVFKHATINEYINRENYFHSIFLSSISFQNTGHLQIYFPALLMGTFLNMKIMKQKHLALLFFTNSLLTTLVTYQYESFKNGQLQMITPKCHGGVTGLSFLTAFLAIKPEYMLLKSRMLPFFMVPAVYAMYEYFEFQKGYMNEVCRPAHLTALAYGLIFGLAFRRFVL